MMCWAGSKGIFEVEETPQLQGNAASMEVDLRRPRVSEAGLYR